MRKLSLAFTLVVLAVLAVSAAPDRIEASGTCSGDDCGCYLEFEPCAAECPPGPSVERQLCIGECRRVVKRCSIACCSW